MMRSVFESICCSRQAGPCWCGLVDMASPRRWESGFQDVVVDHRIWSVRFFTIPTIPPLQHRHVSWEKRGNYIIATMFHHFFIAVLSEEQ